MNTIALRRSTVLADAHVRRVEQFTRVSGVSSVRVGAIAMGNRTMVGSATQVLNRAYAPIGVRVGTTVDSTYTTSTTPTSTSETTSSTSTSTSKPGMSTLGKVAGWTLLASMIAGPPAVGYLIGGKIGLAVGAVVAAPMAIMFTMALVAPDKAMWA